MDAIKRYDFDADGCELRRENGEFVKYSDYVAALKAASEQEPFQRRVGDWMLACFGDEISADKMERNHRFFEEATELVQACGMTASEAHQLVDYTFSRPIGEPKQETGGVCVTLAALCNAHGIDQNECAETELARVWTKVEQIRVKQAAKPKHSPLPVEVSKVEPPAAQQDSERLAFVLEHGLPLKGQIGGYFYRLGYGKDTDVKNSQLEAIDAAIQAGKEGK